ncbi:MAG: aminotransferase class I/II-fold pyridoxal phosphate-dependent enzyme [bacterium]
MQKISPYPPLPKSRKKKIRFDLNENPCGCSPKVMAALRNATASDIHLYPEYDELRALIATRFGLAAENILLTDGADDGIRSIMQTYIEPGGVILATDPGFAMTAILAGVMGGVIEYVPYKQDFAFPVKGFLSAGGSNPRLVSIVRPDSPTGAVISRSDLIAVVQKFPHSVILLDETYHHFLGETCIDLIRKFDNLIVIHSFSKAYGLAGLRLGFIAAHPERQREIAKVNQPFPVNSLAVIAGLAAVSDTSYLEKVVAEVETEKEFLLHEFANLGLPARRLPTNFILLDIGSASGFVYQTLLKKNILVKHLQQSPLLKGFFRVTVGKRAHNRILVRELKAALPPEALLFDMDGVLVDVSQSYRLAIRKTAEYFLGQEIEIDEITAYKRRGGFNNDWRLTEALIRARGKSVPMTSIMAIFQKFYWGESGDGFAANERWLLRPGILSALKQSYKIGIVTGRPKAEASHALKRFDLEHAFDVVVALEDVPTEKQKPHPAGISLALSKLCTRRAVYFGDTVDDVKAAIAAGIIAIGVPAPQATVDSDSLSRLEQAGAEFVLHNINELKELFL